ncbi:hypothetical protein BV22DRAFT_193492 [Leucogyrophana mollusca]|uniref:Uncharacterized protein n=1 Tax=Leucogyrophana mollusca TaxID=85980 RepID=A0ACB8BSD8_9AGAM|nr:hypothetical protein BV22DRAFT_193492 [Leucogyrophana mollusca]
MYCLIYLTVATWLTFCAGSLDGTDICCTWQDITTRYPTSPTRYDSLILTGASPRNAYKYLRTGRKTPLNEKRPRPGNVCLSAFRFLSVDIQLRSAEVISFSDLSVDEEVCALYRKELTSQSPTSAPIPRCTSLL